MTVGEGRPEGVPGPADGGPDQAPPPDERLAVDDADEYAELLPRREPFRSALKAVGLIEQAIGLALIVVILVLVLIQVGQRYIHTFGGWPWTGEVARLAMVWCTFALAGYLMAQERHITIKVADLVLPERILDLVKLGAHLVVLLTCLGMGFATYSLIADDIGQRTPAAEIPVAWVYVMPLVGYLLTAVRASMYIGLVDVPRIVRGRERPA
jgi:TRAP-type C4-dicarboxylate transport system permease small subunit